MTDKPSLWKRFLAKLTGSGAIAQGDGAVAGGEKAIVAGRDIIFGDQNILLALSPGETDPAVLKEAYLRRVIYDTGFLSLEGIDPKAAVESGRRMNLASVYTALLTQTSEQRELKGRYSDEFSGDFDVREARLLSAVTMLDRYDRLVLLGDPGSGKSTFVNFVALCMAGAILGDSQINLELLTSPLPDDKGQDIEERQPWRHGLLMPVRVILRDFAASECFAQTACANALWEFIENYLRENTLPEFSGLLKNILRGEGGLLLLDGLDEIPEAEGKRERMKQAISEFMAVFQKCRVVLTSRTYAYQRQDWKIPGFQETVLQPFGRGQMIRFMERWFQHVAVLRNWNPNDAQGKAERLKTAVFSNERLMDLARRPLLLTLMASLHAWRGGTLPEKREELYANTVDLLLDWWESSKVIRSPDGSDQLIQPSLTQWLNADREEVRRLLQKLSFKAHEAQPDLHGTADLPEGDLVSGLIHLADNPEKVNPALLVDYLSRRAGLLAARGVGVYSFPHRTIQEYLTACYLTEESYPDKTAELARCEPNRWREVALLAGAKAARGADFALWSLVEALCFLEKDDRKADSHDMWGAHIAGQVLAETARLKSLSNPNRIKKDRVVDWLVKIIQGNDLPPIERALAGRSLAVLGDPRPEVTAIDGMAFCFVPAGPFIMGEDDETHENHCLDYGFWIGKHPVSNQQYQAFVEAGGYGQESFWKEAKAAGYWKSGKFKGRFDDVFRSGPFDFGAPYNLSNHPVVGVSWYETLAFSRWLTDTWRHEGILAEDLFVRLPSEAEWEKTARGGLEIPQEVRIARPLDKTFHMEERIELRPNPRPDRIFPWGDTGDTDRPDANLANYEGTNIGFPSALGCFNMGQSPYGCLDMSGNVSEWTRSLWGKNLEEADFKYPYRPEDGREDEFTRKEYLRVLRGGAFDHPGYGVRCAVRYWGFPNGRGWYDGFRVVLSPNYSGR